MKNNEYIFFLFILIILIGCNNTNEPDETTRNGDLEITITTNSSEPVKDSKVFLSGTDFKSVTDSYGKVLFRSVPEGIYETYSYLEGYGSGKETIEVKSNMLNKASIMFTYGVFLEPKITRIEPYYGTKTAVNDTIIFKYNIVDNQTSSENISVTLSSSIDGILVSSNLAATNVFVFKTNELSKGEHIIRIEAQDSDGYTGKDSVIIKNVKPPRVSLSAPVVMDGGVKLEWSICNDPTFNRYEVFQISDPSWSNGQRIATITEKENTTFFDSNPLLLDSAYYRIVSYNNEGENTSSRDNKVIYPAGELYKYSLKDAVIHPTLPYIYLTTFHNELICYDYETEKIVNTETYSSAINFLEIGDNGIGIELYLPDNNGFINILDPLTLDKIFSVQCNYPITSVAVDGNGIIYAGLEPSPWWDKPVRSYSRSDGTEIDGNGKFAEGRVRLLSDKKALIQITSNSTPANMEYFELDGNGYFTLFKEDSQHGAYPLSYIIFKVAQNGEFVITSTEGALYKADESMEYLGKLSNGETQFSDFEFKDDGQTIYASSSNNKSIFVYSYTNFSLVNTIETKGYPFKIFLKHDKIIIVSKTIVASYWENSRILFETITVSN